MLCRGPQQRNKRPVCKDIETSSEMFDEVMKSIDNCDVIISAAAISDYKPSNISDHKHKKQDGGLTIHLVRGSDILKTAKEKNKNKSYHIDFLFLKGLTVKSFDIGSYEDWIGFSDHMPLICEI